MELKHTHGWAVKQNNVDLQMAFNKTLRDNLGQMWPTDPRHSWWKRNRCCVSLEDCRVCTLDCESEAPILPSERSCPPSHDRKGEQSYPVRLQDRNRRERTGETDRVEMREAALHINKCSDVTLLSCENMFRHR